MGKDGKTPVKRFLSMVKPSAAVEARARKRVMTSFAEKLGLVYFGYVDQKHDEHSLVRGLTLSRTHKDKHYSIGSFEGYDIILLERSDIINFPGKPARVTKWLVLAIDLHTKADLPHVFIGHSNHSETFYAHLFTAFSHLQRVYFGTLGQHSDEFNFNYRVFTHASKAYEAEQLFTPELTSVIGANFRPLEIELHRDVLYIYADDMMPTQQLLGTMVKNGLWLAQQIDKSQVTA